jgi:hypothetical protein
MSRQEFVAHLRRYNSELLLYSVACASFSSQDDILKYFPFLCRKSSGFSRGASMYRGVTRFLSLFRRNSLFQLVLTNFLLCF